MERGYLELTYCVLLIIIVLMIWVFATSCKRGETTPEETSTQRTSRRPNRTAARDTRVTIARTLWSSDVSTVVMVIFFTLNQTARRPHAYRSSWRRMRRICPAMKRSCVCAI
ncbi:PREDICTED: uncharacterized protein LOC108616406 isoform X15 [Drosophila arizonae]|uniref:Uncharacterized protein LOC108616406 isoform X15 n=1 Tax=Drosophila arizonae TaxID=7263 RepID=A0ABM1PIP1_DROAR|nr:PREDICTED: uncharacterized protein LOC108616406 isoform X15 [Drosophila arizonae]